jgi:starch synthase
VGLQGYAWEITTPEGGWGLHHILSGRGNVLSGITNGIDMEEWNPATDTYLPVHFTPEDISGMPGALPPTSIGDQCMRV